MASPVNRTYLRQTQDAAELLGKLIRLGRKERKMTEEDLSGQAWISRRTLQKIERGDLKCEIGLVFEVANIVGVKLFSDEQKSYRYATRDTLTINWPCCPNGFAEW